VNYIEFWRQLMLALVLAGLAGCSQPPPPPASVIAQDEAMRVASETAQKSRPEVGMLQARIETVSAELTTLTAADARRGVAESSARVGTAPIWSVSVFGSFQFEGMSSAGTQARQRYEAAEQVFVVDARTGEILGSTIVSARPSP
jgi:hypothetical protein